MRISDPWWLAGALTLAGCSGGQEERQAAAQNSPAAEQKPGLVIDCALAGHLPWPAPVRWSSRGLAMR